MNVPRILVAGLRGGSGKTLVSLGLAAALARRGRRVTAFKKGPDYIDAAWLSRVTGKPCRNLDLFLMSAPTVLRSFAAAAADADVALIEGNRGLFDGVDAQGTYSTAELAKLLACPVVLVVDCTKSTRTVAAAVLGCQTLDPQVSIRGVILNQTAGPRHDAVLREAIEQVCCLPVLGAIPRLGEQLFPQRHLGLVPPQEHDEVDRAIDQVAGAAEQYLDLAALERLARQARALELKSVGQTFLSVGQTFLSADAFVGWDKRSAVPPESGRSHFGGTALRLSHPTVLDDDPILEVVHIGVFRDAAFQFYYPENLEALVRNGARLIEISPLVDAELPDVDALYIGGGFPETLAAGLAANGTFLRSLCGAVERGLPVYAECGGAVFLGAKLLMDEKQYPMAAVLPVDFAFAAKPQGHGYAVLETVQSNAFYPVGEIVRGHEFHYTYMQPTAAKDLTFAFRVQRGVGLGGQRDGLCRGNVLASYTHVHALATECWAPALVQAAVRFRNRASDILEASERER